MFSIKRMMSLGLMLFTLSTMLVFTTGVASARTASPSITVTGCYDTTCDGKNPISTNCDSDAITEYSATSSDLGGGLRATAALRFSSRCQATWAKVTFNKSLPSPHNGDAIITRKSDNKIYDCATAGGNGVVLPGQTSCYTSMVGDAYPKRSYAIAEYWSSSTLWKQVATTAAY